MLKNNSGNQEEHAIDLQTMRKSEQPLGAAAEMVSSQLISVKCRCIQNALGREEDYSGLAIEIETIEIVEDNTRAVPDNEIWHLKLPISKLCHLIVVPILVHDHTAETQ